ncbi:diguanylate cyclase [Clostridium aestuarii]|uniref:Diguanylate cyclase n=1 Tax=Clostridium aestuarii TaxID=338193 RepID=A0ABT4D6X5_9CLOT|nr:diguanylate cyclase [Clostridium aestuarii]MCY6485753.1 diguanylate cyclase [Clostridium aestuarii]
MKLKNISIRYSVMIIMMAIIIPILLIITGINYFNLKSNILKNAFIVTNESKLSVIETINRTEKSYELVSSYYDHLMKESLNLFKDEYNKHKNDLESINFEEMKEKYNSLLDFYIIDKNGIIIYSTFPKALGIDFKQIPDFYENLTQIRKGNNIEISKVTSEIVTYELRKWGYSPTDDHEYILEVGLSSEELKKYIKKVDYAAMEKELKKNNPYIKNLFIYDHNHFVLGHYKREKNQEELKIIEKVLSTEKNYIINNKKGVVCKEYIFVNTFYSTLEDSKKVIQIEYDYSTVDEKLKEITKSTGIVISIYILLALLIVSYATSKLITRPIVYLTKRIKAISDKNLNVQVEIYVENEIGQLAASFNEMSNKLATTLISKNNLENIINSVGDLFIILDKDLRIIKINEYGLNLLGYDLKGLENKPIHMIFDETFDEEKIIKDIKEKGTAENIENTLIKSNGFSSLVLSIFTCLKDEDGKINGYTCISKDITKTKQQLDQMEKINQRLKIEENRLREKNTKDWLTKVLNREHIFKYLEEVLRISFLEKTDISIVLCDIDYFKNVNDNYGHQAGDMVLQQVASIIEESIRGKDAVGRYGGEEFLIVLPNADAEKAWHIFERIRKKIEASSFNEGEIKITISGGVAACKEKSIKELIAKADENLYISKRSGRNRGIK